MNKLVKIAGAIAVINIVARLVGFLREMVIGYQYGTSFVADSIFTAYTLPNFIYLVIGGAITTAFISRYHHQKDGQRFTNQVFTQILVAMTVLTLVLVLFARPILSLLFGDLTNEQYDLALSLYYWMMSSALFLVLSTWISGLLNIRDRFRLSAFAVLLYNALFVGVAVGFSIVIGPIGYGIGALVAALGMVGFLVWGYRRAEPQKLRLEFKGLADTKALWLMAFPIMLGGATQQFYVIIQRIFSAGLGDGLIAAVNYATKMTQFPQAILMTAVTTVIYPLLAKKQAANELDAIQTIYQRGIRLLILLIIPVSVFAYLYAETLIRSVFEYGNFTSESTQMTVPLFKIFALSMFFIAANMYITRFFYARGNSTTPVVFSLINVFVLNIAIIVLFIDTFQASAIAWGTLISTIVNFGMLVVVAAKKYDLRVWSTGLVKLLVAVTVMALLLYGVRSILVFDARLVDLAIGGVAFGGIFVLVCLVFRIDEIGRLLKRAGH